MSVIIYGPQGCGKTTHKAALLQHFNLAYALEDWNPGDPIPEDTLVLTNIAGVEGAIDFTEFLTKGL